MILPRLFVLCVVSIVGCYAQLCPVSSLDKVFATSTLQPYPEAHLRLLRNCEEIELPAQKCDFSRIYYEIVVPTGTTYVIFSIAGGYQGDAHMFIRKEALPAAIPGLFDYADWATTSSVQGLSRSVEIVNPVPGRYFIQIRPGQVYFAGVKLKVCLCGPIYVTPPTKPTTPTTTRTTPTTTRTTPTTTRTTPTTTRTTPTTTRTTPTTTRTTPTTTRTTPTTTRTAPTTTRTTPTTTRTTPTTTRTTTGITRSTTTTLGPTTGGCCSDDFLKKIYMVAGGAAVLILLVLIILLLIICCCLSAKIEHQHND